MVKWALEYKNVVHDNGGVHSLQLGKEPSVVYSVDVDDINVVDATSLKLVAIYLPGHTIDESSKCEMRDACEFIQVNSHCKEKGFDRRGASKRGPICMTSIGFNFAAHNHGKISVYKRRSNLEAMQIELWGHALHYLKVVRSILHDKMGFYPLQALGNRCSVIKGVSPSMLNMCTSVHQTLDAEVWPHVDTGDVDYTVITWAQKGDVFGPFLLHALGVAFDVQVSMFE
jgi:hypothetical protein